jgi:predicted signal transduction protein with EAL and GGDEF domain
VGAQKVLNLLTDEFRLDAVVGLARFPEDGITPEELQDFARQAMLFARQAGLKLGSPDMLETGV